MVTKMDVQGVKVDWKKVELATEVKRTYLVKDRFGHEFFKMYKPSETASVFKKHGWTGQIVSTIDRSRRKS